MIIGFVVPGAVCFLSNYINLIAFKQRLFVWLFQIEDWTIDIE